VNLAARLLILALSAIKLWMGPRGSPRGTSVPVDADNRASGWIKEQFTGFTFFMAIEVEHVVQWTRNCVKRSARLDAPTE
jgi:hypothetical protein